jgi:hypothetical protein
VQAMFAGHRMIAFKYAGSAGHQQPSTQPQAMDRQSTYPIIGPPDRSLNGRSSAFLSYSAKLYEGLYFLK